MAGERSRCLIVFPAWVGDAVATHSLVQALRQRHPDLALDALAAPALSPLLERMPELERIVPSPFGHGELRLAERCALGRSLRGRYALAFVLPRSMKSALVPWAAGIPVRTGWRGEWRYGILNDVRRIKAAPRQLVERYAALACPAGTLKRPVPAPRLAVERARAEATAAAMGLRVDRPALALCPGAAYGSAKRWPAARYAEIAAAHAATGWQVWLLGVASEAPIAEELLAGLDAAARAQCRNLVGLSGLGEVVDLLSLADAVVSNDSGLMHVAAALGVPRQVAVFGPTSPENTPPLNPRAQAVSLSLSCAPCFRPVCPLGHNNCMRELDSQRVLDALGASAPPPC